MASVEKRLRDGRTTYLVRWRDEANLQRKKSFTRKVDADRYRAEVEHSMNVGSYVDPAAGRRTVREYAEGWRLAQPHRPNTAGRVQSQLTRHVYPVLGSRPIAAVRPSEIQAFVATLSATLAPGSIRTLFATVSAIFGAALRDRLVSHDPTERIALPTVQRLRVVPLTVEQVDALLDALPPRYRAVGVVAAGTGLRQGEVFGLQVRDVDFLRRVVRVERQLQPTPGGGFTVGPPKNRAAYRAVPVGRVVIDALAEHLAAYPAAGEAFIFRDDDGEPLTRGTFNGRVWHPARRAAGLLTVGMHDLRHFYASALIRAGLNVKVVSERLGHSNAAMTLNVYSHLWPDDEDRTRQAIDDVLGARVPRTRPELRALG